MGQITIEGRKVTVSDDFFQLSPEQQDATVDEIARSPEFTGGGPSQVDQMNADFSSATLGAAPNQNANPERTDNYIRANMEARKIDEWRNWKGTAGDLTDAVGHSGGMAVADDAYSAIFGAPLRMMRDGVGYGEAFEREQLLANAQKLIREERSPTATTVGNVVGSLGSMNLTGAAPISFGKVVKTAAKTGGLTGGVYGFGEAEGGWKEKGLGALGGSVAGTVLGAGIPIVAKTVKSVAKPVFDAIYSARWHPEQFATQKIAERITSNGSTIETLAKKMAKNPGSSVADVGPKSARTLLRTAVNIPGPAKDRVVTQLNVRQFGQGDRIKDVISKTFADPDAYLSQKEAIAAATKKAAAPLWKQAMEKPVHYSESLEAILNTSAGKSALSKAEQLASNEQEPFKQIFVNVMENGQMVAKRVPDARGWQYVKSALDDMINAQTDSITGKMTNEGRIIVGLKNRMLSELDAANPAYAAARKASATGFELDNALEFGRKSLTMSPEALKRQLAGMNPAEREAARVGAADAMRAEVDRAGWTNNAALKVVGGRQRRQNLEMLFESKEKFNEASKAMFAEMRKRTTYDTVKGNSTTAAQMADMADAGGLDDAVQFATKAATQGPINATFSWIGSHLKMMGGLTPKVADEISKKLMTTNPATVRQLTNELMKLQQANISAAGKAQNTQALLSRFGLMPTVETTLPNQKRLN